MLTTREQLAQSSQLVARFHLLHKGMVASSEKTIEHLVKILEEARVSYAIIGGIAVHLWRAEPRTTLDIDIAVLSYDALPVAMLTSAGFSHTGRFDHSDNWRGPDGTPVQFTDEPALHGAIARAIARDAGIGILRVVGPTDLIKSKLLSASDASLRKSKRLQDLADAQGLREDNPNCAADLNAEELLKLQSVNTP